MRCSSALCGGARERKSKGRPCKKRCIKPALLEELHSPSQRANSFHKAFTRWWKKRVGLKIMASLSRRNRAPLVKSTPKNAQSP